MQLDFLPFFALHNINILPLVIIFTIGWYIFQVKRIDYNDAYYKY